MRLHTILVVLSLCPAIYCQNALPPLTETCHAIEASIVQVSSDTMQGTGFIVDPNGWIITALHVVADPATLIKRDNISVSIVGHKGRLPAKVVSPLDNLAQFRDFAILKVDRGDLPFLKLGSEINADDGTPIAVVGFPLSAMFRIPPNPIPRFCLTGTIAAQTAFPLGNLEFLHTLYFQGVSIKGISGAPIVSQIDGKVIGMVTTKLTGINQPLDELKAAIDNPGPGHMEIGLGPGLGAIGGLGRVIDLLDTQLANGLGSGTGTSDMTNTLERVKKGYDRQHPRQ
jgi:hypothetical protein